MSQHHFDLGSVEAIVTSRLLELYSPEAAGLWLQGFNPRLGGRKPIDLVREGRTADLLDAIAQESAGSFA